VTGGDPVEDDRPAVKVRGIYATGLTRRLLSADFPVVQASEPIRRRFDDEFPARPADAAVETTDDRLGVGVTGDPASVRGTVEVLDDVGLDALPFRDPAPAEAVFDATVGETLGGGAAVDLGDREGYLPYDDVEGYVDEGDRVRVQVTEPVPPWADRRPELGADLRVGGELVTLVRGESGISVAADRERTTELARTTELLSAEPHDGWALRWEHAALEAGMEAMDDALATAAERAEQLESEIESEPPDVEDHRTDPTERPREVATPTATRWVLFGRESRFALDRDRRSVTRTMPGHHRIKAGHEAASAAVDFVEAVCDPGAGSFPFEAVTDQFGPAEGDRVELAHGKPDGRTITLGRAEVVSVDPDGKVRIRREIRSSGEYDALGTRRNPGDLAITRIKEGRWWYPTVYRGDDRVKGTYVNVCTPVEVFPDAIRYVDLYVDVIKRPDGEVERVDDDELDEAVESGRVPEPLAEKARDVAAAVEDALDS